MSPDGDIARGNEALAKYTAGCENVAKRNKYRLDISVDWC